MTSSEAAAIKAGASALLGDVTLVQTALALPALEPLVGGRVAKVAALGRGCLQAAAACAGAAVALSAAPTATKAKEEASEADAPMVGVVETALAAADVASEVLAASKHVEKATLRNVQAVWAAALLRALWNQVNLHYCKEG